jgi:hypothetical protein
MHTLLPHAHTQIRCSWYKLCIAAQDATIYPHVVDMLSSQGRMKVCGCCACMRMLSNA